MANEETKETKETKTKKNSKKSKGNLLPFDELPVHVKRNRRNLYEYIRTGELP